MRTVNTYNFLYGGWYCRSLAISVAQAGSSISWPLRFSILYAALHSSWLSKWLTSRGKEKKKTPLCHNEHQLHFVSAGSPFVPHCSFSRSHSPVTQLNAILPLCFPHHMNPSTSLSLSLSHHSWLHSFHPWGPIDRLQQPFNEISPVPLEEKKKKNVVQSNR